VVSLAPWPCFTSVADGPPGAPTSSGAPLTISSGSVQLRDGAVVGLRTATGDDDARLRAMFFTLSDQTRYFYFCTGVPANDAWAARVASLGVSRDAASYAMVAEVGKNVIGVARFDRDAREPRAEIGILLTDAWQSRGLGREVVAQLRCVAQTHGIASFTATVLGENRRALRMLRRAFPNMHGTWGGGQYELALPFTSIPAAAPPVER
jgi:RimJ/RimL family protein N-acetyltransferase